MTEPETNYSSEVDVFSEPDKSAHDSESGYRRRRQSYHPLSDVQTDNSVAKVYKMTLFEKYILNFINLYNSKV
jgi:hypothetical protein